MIFRSQSSKPDYHRRIAEPEWFDDPRLAFCDDESPPMLAIVQADIILLWAMLRDVLESALRNKLAKTIRWLSSKRQG
jgi:hypothetical protein